MIFQLTGINLVFALSAVYGLGIFTCWLYLRARRRANTAEDPALQPIKALLDSIDDLAWIKDSDSRFVLVNRKFGEVFGIEPAQLIGKSDADLSSPELAERYQMDDYEVMRSKLPSRIVEQIARPNGTMGWSETLKVPVFDCDGNTVGTAGVARDVTERHQAHTLLEQRVSERTQEMSTTLETLKRTQDELIQREKVAALGDLVAGIAHELNTPIGNSLTVASTLQDQARDFHEQIATKLTRSGLDQFIRNIQDGSDILVRSLQKAAELVNSFKQVAVDQTSVNRRTFDLCELVEEVLLTHGPTFRKTPHCIKHTIAQGIALDSYPGPLGQVITNLVHNALIHGLDDACPGNVVITGYMAGEDHIIITVKDDGRGIAADILPRIFDPFFTTRLGKGGSGLGLNIVHSLVIGVLGGSIAASSDGPSGALFTAKIPTAAPLHPTVVI